MRHTIPAILAALLLPGAALAGQTTPPAKPAAVPAPPAATGAKPATPLTQPGSWFAQLDIPAESLARGQTGAVGVKIDVDAKGAVTNCTVAQTSGWPQLDAVTCLAVKARAKFAPATDAAGKPIASSVALPLIRYTIKEGQSLVAIAGGKRTVFNRTIRVVIDKAGLVTACTSLNPDMTDKAACADYPVGKAVPAGAGSKTGVARTVTISLTAVADYADAP